VRSLWTRATLSRAVPSSSVSFASITAAGVNSSGTMKSGAWSNPGMRSARLVSRKLILADDLRIMPGRVNFYLHFKDRGALLAQWRDGRVASIAAQAAASRGADAAPAVRLRRLLDLYLDHANPRGMAIELAMRDWARRDAAAAAAVASVDAALLATLVPLYRALGHARQEAQARALALYAFIFGQSLILEGVATAKAARSQGALCPAADLLRAPSVPLRRRHLATALPGVRRSHDRVMFALPQSGRLP
jgi:hypothetical protein